MDDERQSREGERGGLAAIRPEHPPDPKAAPAPAAPPVETTTADTGAERLGTRCRQVAVRSAASISPSMLRIYLDQNHWVSLLKVRTQHDGGNAFRDVALLLEEAVNRSWISLPLSMAHAMELGNRANFESRLRLATTMLELSKWHAIAPQRVLVAGEIDRALHVRFGRPAAPRRPQVFGVGADHLFGRRLIDYQPPSDIPLTVEQRRVMTQWGSQLLQVAALVGAPRSFTAPKYDPTAHRKVAVRFGEEQEQIRNARRPEGYHRGELGVSASCADTFGEYSDVITESLELAGLHWGHLYALEKEGLTAFLEDVPTMFAHRELRRLRHEASQKRWEENDLTDLSALAPALVYCDAVVTERLWTALASRAKLGARFETVVHRSLNDLVPLLLGAAVA
jgi:hypothetical protein